LRTIRPIRVATIVLAAALASSLAGCKQENRYVPPPPPQVGVALPVQRAITRYITGTGNLTAVNQVDLVARVPGFLQEIDYKDGATVPAGQTLFVVEPRPYQLQLQQAQADIVGKEGQLKQTEAEYNRQARLGATEYSSRSTVDVALANRDVARAGLAASQTAVETAQVNLSYTQVKAPFDGMVSAHLVSVGELVGSGQPTRLATITQLDPIWVTFTLSEQDVLRVQQSMHRRGLTRKDFGKVPVEIGLQNETGYPHQGVLDYADPGLDPATGTLTVRGVFDNADRLLLPGLFVRVRVPVETNVPALLVPEAALGADQLGPTLLMVDAEDVVELRHVAIGDPEGDLREITAGLKPDERLVVEGLQRAVPGEKVTPAPRPATAQ
jgi:RND family efflux transporter MFP subunit